MSEQCVEMGTDACVVWHVKLPNARRTFLVIDGEITRHDRVVALPRIEVGSSMQRFRSTSNATTRPI